MEEVKESRKILSQAHRPNSSHPNFYNPTKRSEKKPEFLTSQDFYDESNEEFKILGNASKMYARPGSGLNKSSSTNEISSTFPLFLLFNYSLTRQNQRVHQQLQQNKGTLRLGPKQPIFQQPRAYRDSRGRGQLQIRLQRAKPTDLP